MLANNGIIKLQGHNYINRNVIIAAHQSITIGKGTTIGPNTVIFDHDHGDKDGTFETAEVKIGSNVWIGAGCIILKGSIIGENTVIGAGSLVMGTVPSNVTFVNKRNNIFIERNNDGGMK